MYVINHCFNLNKSFPYIIRRNIRVSKAAHRLHTYPYKRAILEIKYKMTKKTLVKCQK